jgi:DnaK suppressor protein
MHEMKARLVATREELRSDLAGDAAVLGTELDARGEDTTPSQHPADVASDLYTREELVTDELALAKQLDEVEDALERIAKDQYGRCVECGRHIPAERLAALPQAARCIECQRRRERTDRR